MINTPLITRAQSAQRYLMIKYLSGKLPLYIVNEYPKSGGTWVGQLLSKSLNLPFPRNSFRKIRKSIIHGHFQYDPSFKNVVCVWRDGRDLMVSWYYHCLFPNQFGNEKHVNQVRKHLQFDDYEDIKSNLLKFIEYSFERQVYPKFSWSDFVDQWYIDNEEIIHVKYEDLRRNTADELQQLTKRLGFEVSSDKISDAVAEFDFEKQKKIAEKALKGGQVNFIRSGSTGGWRNVFSEEDKKIFDHYAGAQLEKLGYER